jgi:hypothetical protein
MKTHSVLITISLVLAVVYLGAGYLIFGYWQILPALLVIVLFWIFTRKLPGLWPASSVLLVIVLLSAIGITAGLHLLPMLAASTAALVTWDLTLFAQGRSTNQQSASIPLFERKHLQSLAMAASAGLLLAWGSSYLNFHLPFILMVLFVLLAIIGLVYGIKRLMV